MSALLKNRRDVGLLLGPVFYEFCCRLRWLTAGLSPEKEALLFMARGGLRLQYLFDLFLKVNDLEMPIRRMPLWISRFAAVKMTFAENPELAVANLVREFSICPCRILADALLPGAVCPEKPQLTATLPPDLAEAPVGRENVFRLFHADCPFSQALRRHFQEQHDISCAFFEKQFGAFGTLHLVDSGWFGSTVGSLQTGFPRWRWDGFFFGRWNYRNDVPWYFHDIIGLMIDAVGLKGKNPVDIFLEYHHLLESVLEPDLPSTEYYLPEGRSNAELPGWEARVEGTGTEPDEMWEGVKAYFLSRPSVSLGACTKATAEVLKIWKRLLRYPTPAEARLLEVPPRSADFGKNAATPVFFAPMPPLRDRWRTTWSLWPAGAIAVSGVRGVRLRQLLWHLGRKLSDYRGAV